MDVAQEMARRSHDALEQPQMSRIRTSLAGAPAAVRHLLVEVSLIEALDDEGSRALRADDRGLHNREIDAPSIPSFIRSVGRTTMLRSPAGRRREPPGARLAALMRRKPLAPPVQVEPGLELHARANLMSERRFVASALDLARPRRRLGDVSDHLAHILLLRFECYVGLRDDADESIVFVDDR